MELLLFIKYLYFENGNTFLNDRATATAVTDKEFKDSVVKFHYISNESDFVGRIVDFQTRFLALRWFQRYKPTLPASTSSILQNVVHRMHKFTLKPIL